MNKLTSQLSRSNLYAFIINVKLAFNLHPVSSKHEHVHTRTREQLNRLDRRIRLVAVVQSTVFMRQEVNRE
jgi:hypothetical protein